MCSGTWVTDFRYLAQDHATPLQIYTGLIALRGEHVETKKINDLKPRGRS